MDKLGALRYIKMLGESLQNLGVDENAPVDKLLEYAEETLRDGLELVQEIREKENGNSEEK